MKMKISEMNSSADGIQSNRWNTIQQMEYNSADGIQFNRWNPIQQMEYNPADEIQLNKFIEMMLN